MFVPDLVIDSVLRAKDKFRADVFASTPSNPAFMADRANFAKAQTAYAIHMQTTWPKVLYRDY